MTRFVTYDPEVAARLAQAVGVHRVELRDASALPRKVNPAILDLIRTPRRNALLMPSSDEQVLIVCIREEARKHQQRTVKKRKKRPKKTEGELREVGSQPSGFLGLHDEPVFSDEPEDPPRSLWKRDN